MAISGSIIGFYGAIKICIREGFNWRDVAELVEKEIMKDTVITGIKLVRKHHNGNEHAVVEIEVHGTWVELIREPISSNFSHIVEPAGIRQAINFACDEQSYGDLITSGGL
jgi:hypothetical protein